MLEVTLQQHTIYNSTYLLTYVSSNFCYIQLVIMLLHHNVVYTLQFLSAYNLRLNVGLWLLLTLLFQELVVFTVSFFNLSILRESKNHSQT